MVRNVLQSLNFFENLICDFLMMNTITVRIFIFLPVVIKFLLSHLKTNDYKKNTIHNYLNSLNKTLSSRYLNMKNKINLLSCLLILRRMSMLEPSSSLS